MKEYRVVCDVSVYVDNELKRVVKESAPYSSTGICQRREFNTYEEAYDYMEKVTIWSAEFMKKQERNNKAYPDLCTTLHQIYNYRIQSREVSEWQ